MMSPDPQPTKGYQASDAWDAADAKAAADPSLENRLAAARAQTEWDMYNSPGNVNYDSAVSNAMSKYNLSQTEAEGVVNGLF